MKFSVITPSFRASDWLRLCIASVADQNVDCEHIVQDACSDDGTQEWLVNDRRVKAYIEKDEGMYDAINRGLRRASGDIIAYLNADEQYLPGALQFVGDYFAAHPRIEVLFASAVIVDKNGDYLAHRLVTLPAKLHTLIGRSLAILTCSTFFRRSLIDSRQLFFNGRFRNVGDAEWISRLIGCGAQMARHSQFTSVYSWTGSNLSLSPEANHERELLARSVPWIARQMRLAITGHHRLRRLFAGHYRQLPPFTYAIYTMRSPVARVAKNANSPTFVWPDCPSASPPSPTGNS